jgi:hypothetical protein
LWVTPGCVGGVVAGARGHQLALVAEPAGVEDRRHLADDALTAQRLDPFQDLAFRHADPVAERGERPGHQRQVVLELIEQESIAIVHASQHATKPRVHTEPKGLNCAGTVPRPRGNRAKGDSPPVTQRLLIATVIAASTSRIDAEALLLRSGGLAPRTRIQPCVVDSLRSSS